MVPRTVLVVCPSAWDFAQIPAAGDRLRGHDLRFAAEEAEDFPHTFDAIGFVDETVRTYGPGGSDHIDGITTSSDYPGCIVAARICVNS